ncbi:MAG: hypothetical protein ACRDPY_06405 [Streptosporangiaceae bacterium]
MSGDRDHTVATARVTSEEKPYGVRIDRLITVHGVDDDQRTKLAGEALAGFNGKGVVGR